MRSERARIVAAVGLLALACEALVACGNTAYHCGPNRVCDPGSICTPNHECARPDPVCPSGYRTSDTASNPGQCIPMLMPVDGGDLDSASPDATEVDVTSDGPRVFYDAAPYDGPVVTGEFVVEQYDITGTRGSTAQATFTTDTTPSCVPVDSDANCSLRTCPVNAGGPNDRPSTLADIGTIHTNLAAFPSLMYVGGIGYSELSSTRAFGNREDVQVWNDGAPGFFAQLVSPAASHLAMPVRDGTITRSMPVLTVTTEGADLVYVRLEQTLSAGTAGQVLTCWLMQQGGTVTIPARFLSLANFPQPTAALSVYSARRLLLGATGRSIALRHNTNLADETRVDRMSVQLSP